MKKVIFFIFIVIVAICMTGCMAEKYDLKTGKETHMTYILPNGFECIGRIAIEERGYTNMPMLICDDGTIYHNISNYRAVTQLNPLYNGIK